MNVSQDVSWQMFCAIWDFNAVCETEKKFITDSSMAASMINATANAQLVHFFYLVLHNTS